MLLIFATLFDNVNCNCGHNIVLQFFIIHSDSKQCEVFYTDISQSDGLLNQSLICESLLHDLAGL